MGADDARGYESLDSAVKRAFEPASPDRLADMRSRVLAGVRRSAGATGWRRAAARVSVALATMLAVLGGGTYAVARSLPGGTLYPVKRAAEEAALAVIPAGGWRAQVLRNIAARRAREVHELLRIGASPARLDAARDELGAARMRAGERVPDPVPPSTVPTSTVPPVLPAQPSRSPSASAGALPRAGTTPTPSVPSAEVMRPKARSPQRSGQPSPTPAPLPKSGRPGSGETSEPVKQQCDQPREARPERVPGVQETTTTPATPVTSSPPPAHPREKPRQH